MRAVLLVVAVLALAGCGSGGGARTGAKPGAGKHEVGRRTAAQDAMAAVVRRWSARLNAGDPRIAELFALPATIEQGPNVYKLVDAQQVAQFHAGLPCTGRITKIAFAGETATATFRLGQRPSGTCRGVGGLVSVRFVIHAGRITGWKQVPVPQDAGGGPVA